MAAARENHELFCPYSFTFSSLGARSAIYRVARYSVRTIRFRACDRTSGPFPTSKPTAFCVQRV